MTAIALTLTSPSKGICSNSSGSPSHDRNGSPLKSILSSHGLKMRLQPPSVSSFRQATYSSNISSIRKTSCGCQHTLRFHLATRCHLELRTVTTSPLAHAVPSQRRCACTASTWHRSPLLHSCGRARPSQPCQGNMIHRYETRNLGLDLQSCRITQQQTTIEEISSQARQKRGRTR